MSDGPEISSRPSAAQTPLADEADQAAGATLVVDSAVEGAGIEFSVPRKGSTLTRLFEIAP